MGVACSAVAKVITVSAAYLTRLQGVKLPQQRFMRRVRFIYLFTRGPLRGPRELAPSLGEGFRRRGTRVISGGEGRRIEDLGAAVHTSLRGTPRPGTQPQSRAQWRPSLVHTSLLAENYELG